MTTNLYLEKARLVARGLLESPEVVASIRQRLIDGDLPSEVEITLWRLAYDEPADRLTRTVSRRPTLTLARRISDDERQERISAAALRGDVEQVAALT